jgi:UDP-3-O-[3-hydroxymyristoyl] glucosamine N-acyltransferase
MIGKVKRYTAGVITEIVGGTLQGDEGLVITGAAGLDEACEHEITFADPKKTAAALSSRAAIVLVGKSGAEEFRKGNRPCIVVDNPRVAFATVLGFFAPEYPREPGVDPRAVVHPSAVLGSDVSIGPYAVVEAGARLGDGVVLYPGVYVGPDAAIGDMTILHPNVTVRERVVVGRRVIIHAGTVVGSDGFGFVTVGGQHVKVPQIGTVVIGDDVEIGALVAIDRATCGKTEIRRGSKLDNLIQIAHNVVVGENCLFAAQVGVAGSAKIGDRCTLAGKAGVVGHLTIGEDCVVMGQGVVAGDLPKGSVVSGTPARPHSEELRNKAAARRLPEALKELKTMRERIEALEELVKSLSPSTLAVEEGKGS